ncbi:MAG: hypothetical protein DRI90_07895 [Deltaproteobacteria bacterium]|nr:MAG: hypothetical protein DRI90_07895 [Deltaproteobacteria bacterium]
MSRAIHRLLPSVCAVVILAAAVAGCDDKTIRAEDCERAPTEQQCRSCCQQAGRNDATWLDDDCLCSSD